MLKLKTALALMAFTGALHAADVKPSPGTPPATPSTPAPAPDAKLGVTKPSAKPEDFIGVWKGKWDGIYGVRFTVSTIQDDKENLSVIYEWEEQLGQPYQRKTIKSKIAGNMLNLNFIEITISPEAADRAIAKGKFARPRTAQLSKEK